MSMPFTFEDFERLDERYMTRKECDVSMSKLNEKLVLDSTKLAVIEAKVGQIELLSRIILTATVGQIVALIAKLLMGG